MPDKHVDNDGTVPQIAATRPAYLRHHSDERVEEEDVGDQDEDGKQGHRHPGVPRLVQDLYVCEPQHQLKHGHEGLAEVAGRGLGH